MSELAPLDNTPGYQAHSFLIKNALFKMMNKTALHRDACHLQVPCPEAQCSERSEVAAVAGWSLYTIFTAGVGADLAIVNTCVNAASLGAFLTIWRGLVLATPAALFPLELGFAQVSNHRMVLGTGWRIMYAVGVALAHLARSRSTSTRRRILPDGDFGTWSMNSNRRMRL